MFLRTDAEDQRKVGTGSAADGADDEAGETHAVFQASSEGVGASVAVGGHEFRHEIAVSAVYFHGVRTGSLRAFRRLSEAFGKQENVGFGKFLGDFPADRAGQG